MNLLNQQHQNDFLARWIYGKLTTKELTTFVNSNQYKNLVSSTLCNTYTKKSAYENR